jgi:hypothetical protein
VTWLALDPAGGPHRQRVTGTEIIVFCWAEPPAQGRAQPGLFLIVGLR